MRTKLLLAQAPLVLALILVAALARLTVSTMAQRSEDILKDNHLSVLAAVHMRDAADDLVRAALRRATAGTEPKPEEVRRLRALFDKELRFQEGNITERGEREMTEALRAAWTALDAQIGAALAGEPGEVPAAPPLLAALDRVERATDDILAVNEDAMVRKSERAAHTAESVSTLLLAGTLLAALLAVLATTILTGRIARPLAVLTQAVRRLGEGDLATRARVDGHDEIALLAREFNTMADRLAAYRHSSLGELLSAQQAAQAAIDSLPDPVLVLDFAGTILNVNAAAESQLGLDGTAADDGTWERASPAVREVVDRMRAHVAAGRGPYAPKGLEEAIVVPSPDGNRSLLPRATPVTGETGVATGVAVVLQDVTRLRRFDELKNDLVATVAHELRTPLTSLRMAAHLLAEGVAGPLTERQADLLQAARDDCERLQGIVDDLLDLSRVQSGRLDLRLRPVAARALVEAAHADQRLLAEERGLAFEVEEPCAEGTVLADPDRVRLVLANLTANALRYTPAGGRVTLRARPDDGGVRFGVADTGPGIAPEHIAHLFERFYRVPGSPEGGAGLGLFIAKEIVEAHGGRIGVESTLGEGTTFWFILPAAGRTDSASDLEPEGA